MTSLSRAVINSAGRGTRMGQARPKCLTPILRFPLIHWQLEALCSFREVVVVVGFRAQEVIDTVRAIRPDAEFIMNSEYESTGTAASLSIALRSSESPVISVDGDLLVHPHDLHSLASTTIPAIGVSDIQSLAPVLVSCDIGEDGEVLATAFHHAEPVDSVRNPREWTGLVTLDPKLHHVSGKGHVYQMIAPLLPCPVVNVRCREIDFPAEVPVMENWLRTLIAEGVFHG
jgi:choline kinase